jgi:hypothetical protein
MQIASQYEVKPLASRKVMIAMWPGKMAQRQYQGKGSETTTWEMPVRNSRCNGTMLIVHVSRRKDAA